MLVTRNTLIRVWALTIFVDAYFIVYVTSVHAKQSSPIPFWMSYEQFFPQIPTHLPETSILLVILGGSLHTIIMEKSWANLKVRSWNGSARCLSLGIEDLFYSLTNFFTPVKNSSRTNIVKFFSYGKQIHRILNWKKSISLLFFLGLVESLFIIFFLQNHVCPSSRVLITYFKNQYFPSELIYLFLGVVPSCYFLLLCCCWGFFCLWYSAIIYIPINGALRFAPISFSTRGKISQIPGAVSCRNVVLSNKGTHRGLSLIESCVGFQGRGILRIKKNRPCRAKIYMAWQEIIFLRSQIPENYSGTDADLRSFYFYIFIESCMKIFGSEIALNKLCARENLIQEAVADFSHTTICSEPLLVIF